MLLNNNKKTWDLIALITWLMMNLSLPSSFYMG